MLEIEEFVKLISKNQDYPFKEGMRGRLIKDSVRLADFAQKVFITLNTYSQSHHYNIYISLYYNVLGTQMAKASVYPEMVRCFNANTVLNCQNELAGWWFNTVVEKIREESRKRDFVRCAKVLEKKVRRRECDFMAYVDALFERSARLMIVRVDLYYSKDVEQPVDITCDGDVLNSDLQRMLNNTRHNGLFKYLKGYILKLECGNDRGPHIHCLLFYDGSKVQKDAWYARAVGEYWSSVVTMGRGAYWNCHAIPDQYRRKAIGAINYYDVVARVNLQLVVSYFCKTEQLIENEGPVKFRSMRRGVMPTLDLKSNVGRPRQDKSEEDWEVGTTVFRDPMSQSS